MKHRLLNHVVVALVVSAVAVPLAHATGYDGYKSSYPQLHQLLSGAVSPPGITQYDGYKSSYPQLHAVLAHKVRAPLVPTANRGFDWRDAAIGAGGAAVAIFLIASGTLLFKRRHTRLAL